MAKTHTTITIDLNTLLKAKEASGNFSGLVNRLVNSYLDFEIDDKRRVSEELLQKRLQKLEKELDKIIIEKEKITQQLILVKEEKEMEEIERLERVKAEEEARRSCALCGRVITDREKATLVAEGVRVHSSCFVAADKEQIQQLIPKDSKKGGVKGKKGAL